MGCILNKNQVHVIGDPKAGSESQDRGGSATSKTSKHSGDSGFDDDEAQLISDQMIIQRDILSMLLCQLFALSPGQLVIWSVGHLVSWSLGYLVSGSLCQLVTCPVTWSVGYWSAGLMVSWSLGQLVIWSVGWSSISFSLCLIHSSVPWLVSLTDLNLCCRMRQCEVKINTTNNKPKKYIHGHI